MKRLQKHYFNIIQHDLLLKDLTSNSFKIPKIQKITLNLGLIDPFLNFESYFYANFKKFK